MSGSMSRLQIQNPRERALVGAADRALAALAVVRSPWRRRRPPAEPRRILLLRLERIGDLLMALPAIADVRALAPAAEIHLAVGSWNRSLAGAIRGVDRVLVADASWLARERAGDGLTELLRAARRWGRQSYDLAINFEPDIRSNLMLAATGSACATGSSRIAGGAPTPTRRGTTRARSSCRSGGCSAPGCAVSGAYTRCGFSRPSSS